MKQEIISKNYTDDHGRPAGGYALATGITVIWQNGPLGRVGTDERQDPNGAFVETLLEIARQRLEFYQESFPCSENETAIELVSGAIGALEARTARRVAANVEGTHEGT